MAAKPMSELLANNMSLTITSWGGAYTHSQVKAFQEPYISKSGVDITSVDYNGGLDEIRNQVINKRVIWDVVDMEKPELIRACDEGLLLKINPKILPRGAFGRSAEDDFVTGGLHECGVASIVWAKIIAYDETKFSSRKPATLIDYFDTTAFPGMRGMNKTPKVNLERALISDGVPRNNVYDTLSTKEGVDRAFKKLDSIKDSIVWWESGSEPIQLLDDGKVVMTTAYNGRVFNASVDDKKPYTIIWDHQFTELDYWAILKGTQHEVRAFDFLKYASSSRPLARQTSFISYAPARQSPIKLISKEMQPHMATAPENYATAVTVDYDWWAENQEVLTARFDTWLSQ